MLSVFDTTSGQTKIVPACHEGQNGDGGQRGFGQRQNDAPENAQLAAAIDARLIEQILRNALEELDEQIEAERIRGDGQDQAQVIVREWDAADLAK
jgi:hypothetical protein